MIQSKYEYFRDTDKSFFFTDAENNSSVLHFHRNMEILYVCEGELESTINGEEHTFLKDEIAAFRNSSAILSIRPSIVKPSC